MIDTLKGCDISGVSRLTGISWDEAWGMMVKAVARGQARKKRRIPQYLSIDEKAFEENVPDWRKEEFAAIRKTNLKTGRAWSIKESLRRFWSYSYAKSALGYFQRWYYWATHLRLRPMVQAAKTLNRHLPNILTYFKHRITNTTAEGLNSKIKWSKRWPVVLGVGHITEPRFIFIVEG